MPMRKVQVRIRVVEDDDNQEIVYGAERSFEWKETTGRGRPHDVGFSLACCLCALENVSSAPLAAASILVNVGEQMSDQEHDKYDRNFDHVCQAALEYLRSVGASGYLGMDFK